MPYFAIQTNQVLDETARSEFTKSASAFVAGLLGKSEGYVMVAIDSGVALTFGASGQPAAYAILRSIGLPPEGCNDLAAKISHFLDASLRIPKDRVFIDFTDLSRDRFAWNGKTFA